MGTCDFVGTIYKSLKKNTKSDKDVTLFVLTMRNASPLLCFILLTNFLFLLIILSRYYFIIPLFITANIIPNTFWQIEIKLIFFDPILLLSLSNHILLSNSAKYKQSKLNFHSQRKLKMHQSRMTPQPLKIRAVIEMKCFQFVGVLHIKEAMRKAEAVGNDDCPVKVKLVASPAYVLNTQNLDKLSTSSQLLQMEFLFYEEQGIAILTKAIVACTEKGNRASETKTCCQGGSKSSELFVFVKL